MSWYCRLLAHSLPTSTSTVGDGNTSQIRFYRSKKYCTVPNCTVLLGGNGAPDKLQSIDWSTELSLPCDSAEKTGQTHYLPCLHISVTTRVKNQDCFCFLREVLCSSLLNLWAVMLLAVMTLKPCGIHPACQVRVQSARSRVYCSEEHRTILKCSVLLGQNPVQVPWELLFRSILNKLKSIFRKNCLCL